MRAIITAFRFLTIFPLPGFGDTRLTDLGRAVGWFPLVGLVIGALLAGLNWGLALLLPPGPRAALLLGGWLLVSGGIHFDGFLDSCDGLFGGKTPEQRLTIMRDHRVGAFAVAGGGVLLLLKFGALAAQPDLGALILAPVLGRWVMALAVVFFPYARDQGLGRAMNEHARWPQALLATLITLAAAWFLKGMRGLGIMAGVGLLALLTAWWIRTRIPGLTGDSYGALCELSEAAALTLAVAALG